MHKVRFLLKLFVCLGLTFLLSLSAFAAKADKSDSLLAVLKTAHEDTSKVKTLQALSRNYNNLGQYDLAMKNALESKTLSEKLNYKKGIAVAYNLIGYIDINKSDYEAALENELICLKMNKESGDKRGIAIAYLQIGMVYMDQGDYKKSLENMLMALKMNEEAGNKDGICTAKINIGVLYYYQHNYEKALEYYGEVLKVYKEIDNKGGIAYVYNNIGIIYVEQKKYNEALDALFLSLKMKEEIGNKAGMANTYANIGGIYDILGKNEDALKNYYKSLDINREIGNKMGEANACSNIGKTYDKQGKMEDASRMLNLSLTIMKKIGSKAGMRDSYQGLAEFYLHKKDYKQAFDYYKLYSQTKDSLLNDANSKNMAEMGAKYQTEKKDKQILLLNKDKERQAAEALAESKRQRIILISVLGFLLLAVGFSIFILRSYRQKQRANEIIEHQKLMVEQKQKEVMDSITYAKRLQEAIMPMESLVKKYFPESFIFYKPKDIVAGDFYWMEVKEEGKVFIAAADCTGHGVPGAMVSVVCSNALNRAVLELGITDPGKILDKTSEIVLETFSKSDKDVQDGMDISLALVNLRTKEVAWAGANNPLWYIQDQEMKEIPADKQPVGKFDNPRPFTTHYLKLKKGDSLFLFTDGFADQFGGPSGKKFKYKQFKETIFLNSTLSRSQQMEKLDQAFETWKGNLEQVDDVCVVGITL